jgi:WS/DGAT/MGAT family acyltransferase
MDGMSAFMLDQERPGHFMHTLKISIFSPSEIAPSHEQLRLNLAQCLNTIPMLRWKFLKVPFGLHHPVWVDDPDFDLDYHLRRIVCPPPGDRKAFCDLVSEVYAWPLDQSKPLWLTWVVEGLEDGCTAMIMLLHHAYTDGTGAARIMEFAYSSTPQENATEFPAWVPEPTPGKLQLLLRALIDLPVTLYRCVPKVGKGIVSVRALKKQYEESGKELPPSVLRDSRDSPFNIMLGHGRTFVYERFELAKVKALSKTFGVTINDLFVATAAGAYRSFMQARDYDVDSGPLVAAIPVGKRPPLEEDDLTGNKTSADYIALPIHLADPMERLTASRRAGIIMKEHIKEAEGVDFSSLLEITPPILLRLLDWWVERNGGEVGIWGNAGLSNVPGPREHLYMGDRKLVNWISMGQIFHGLGLNTTVWSYAGNFNLSILADKILLPDGWELVQYFRDAFDEYADLDRETEAAAPEPESKAEPEPEPETTSVKEKAGTTDPDLAASGQTEDTKPESAAEGQTETPPAKSTARGKTGAVKAKSTARSKTATAKAIPNAGGQTEPMAPASDAGGETKPLDQHSEGSN